MPLFDPFENNEPGILPSAEEFNRMQEALRLAGSISGDAATGVRQGANGLQIFDAQAKPFYAKILSGTNPYAWAEVKEALGVFATWGEGRNGTAATSDWPAYEINGATSVPAGTYARMWKAQDGDYYWFEQLGGGSAGSGYTGTKPRVTAVSCTSGGGLSVTTVTDTYVNGDLQP